ncbi:MAG: hypothetical protein WCL32_21190, partial [Planctomycetota bacterium]
MQQFVHRPSITATNGGRRRLPTVTNGDREVSTPSLGGIRGIHRPSNTATNGGRRRLPTVTNGDR